MTEKYIPYSVDGRSYKIPESRSAEFEKTYPSATIRMSVDDRTYNIPLEQKNEFMKTYSNATYAFDEPSVSDAEEISAPVSVDDEPEMNRKERRQARRDARAEDDRTSFGETLAKATGAAGTRFAKQALDLGRMAWNSSIIGGAINMLTGNSYDEKLQDEDNLMTQWSTKLGETADRLSLEADPTGGKEGYLDLIKQGRLGTVLQKAAGSGIESLPMMVAAMNPYSAAFYGAAMAESEYADETRENPDIPAWKRRANAVGQAALELSIERLGGPLKPKGKLTREVLEELLGEAAKEGSETIAKRIFKAIGGVLKEGGEEGLEELGTSFGNDILGTALDAIDGDADYGIKAQWEQLKEENPNADAWEFAKMKGEEYMDSFIGGAVSGMEISSATKGINKGVSLMRGETRTAVQAARENGAALDYADMYDVDALVSESATALEGTLVDKDGNSIVDRAFIDNISADEAYALAGRDDFSGEQRQAFFNYAQAKAASEGLNEKLDSRLNKHIEGVRGRIAEATDKDGLVIVGTLDGKAVYVKDGLITTDGRVAIGQTESGYTFGPVIVIDSVTGEKTTVNGDRILSASSHNSSELFGGIESVFREQEANKRNTARNTMSPAAKLEASKGFVGKKMMVDLGNGIIEVEVQNILPQSGEVLVKGKKGDLGGQSIVKIPASQFYDSISRDDDGNPIFNDTTGETEAEEEVDTPTPTEVVDYRGQELPIVVNGTTIQAEVVSQDDASGIIVYEYTDENGNVKNGSMTIDEFGAAAQLASAPVPAEDVSEEPEPVEVEPEVPQEQPVSEEQETEPIAEPLAPESIDWDTLFEQDQEAYFVELQKQFGEEALDILNEEIEATKSELDAIAKAKTKSQNERLENRKRKTALQNKIDSLSGMAERLTEQNAPEVTAEPEPESEVPVAVPVEPDSPADTNVPEVAAEPETSTLFQTGEQVNKKEAEHAVSEEATRLAAEAIAMQISSNAGIDFREATAEETQKIIDASGVEFSFIGEQGAAALDKAEEATVRLDNLAVAREMESAGKDAKEIKLATGWERGVDKKWRYEISDKDFVIKGSLEGVKPLSEVIEHDELFAAYPHLRDMKVSFVPVRQYINDTVTGILTNNGIWINPYPSRIVKEGKRETLIHEIQHAIQYYEGFAVGGNPRMQDPRKVKQKEENIAELTQRIEEGKATVEELQRKKDELNEKISSLSDPRGENAEEYKEYSAQLAEVINKLDELNQSIGYDDIVLALSKSSSTTFGFDDYQKIAGEVEARNAMARIAMSLDERLNSLAQETEDVAREDQYIIENALQEAASAISFSVANESQAIFVSNAAKAVEAIEMEKATPAQWLAMIEKNGGLKAGEDKWMGLSDWLKASDKKTLTKQEVLNFIGEHMIQIEEVHYSENAEENAADVHSEMERILQEKLNAYKQEWYEENEDESLYGDPAAEYAIEKLREELGDEFPYSFELANGGEVYLTFPYEEDADMRKWSDKLGVEYNSDLRPIHNTRLIYTTSGLTNKREIALVVPTVESFNDDEVHFVDAGDGRAVVWVRFGETYINEEAEAAYQQAMKEGYEFRAELESKYGSLAGGMRSIVTEEEYAHYMELVDRAIQLRESRKTGGKKVLVIDEIQSNRHQKGREKGYKVSREKADAEMDKFMKQMHDKYDFSSSTPFAEVFNAEEMREFARLSMQQHRATFGTTDVPDAPFEKNWHELAMKRMLRYAAENGYDYIAWTKGEQQAERFGISHVVEEIFVSPSEEERFITLKTKFGFDSFDMATEPDSDIIVSGEYKGKKLSEVIGKELADKVLSVPTGTTERLSGNDLKVGGDGMKGFYDKILPAFMNKYGKKWGVKVEDITLPNVEEAGRVMHSVPVTDSMKESVMEGQPMFLKRPNGKIYGWAQGNSIRYTPDGFNPNTLTHEYTHLWAKAMMIRNPKGWQSVKDLLRDTPVWNEVLNDANYSSIHSNEDLVASEVLSRISGEQGAAKLEQMAQQMIDEAKGTMRKLEARGLVQRIKDALNQFWSWVGTELFGIEKFESVEQVADRVLWDLMNQTDLGELREGKTELQIAGEKGAYNLDIEEESGEGVAYRMNALELAEQLESEGVDKKKIRTATGWERGYDGKWRYEIDDLVIKDNIKLKKGMTLGDIAEKNELFKAYPFLADIEVRKMTTKEIMETDADGAYIEDDNTIIVRVQNEDGIIGIDEWEVLVHEVQHAVQHYEGFTAGASESFVRRNARKILREEEKKAKPLYDRMEERRNQLADEMREEVYAQLPKRMSKRDKEIALAKAVDKAKFSDEVFESIRQQWLPYAKRIQTLKILTGDPFYRNRLEDPMVIWDLYKSYAGEVEARNAVDRMYLSDYERAEKTLEETEGTPRELQVAIGESAGIAEARKNKSDYYKDIPPTEYTVLATDLFDKFGSKSVFGCIGNTANYYYLCDYFGDSKHPKVRAIFKIDANDETRRAFDSEVYRKGGFSPSDIDAILEKSWDRGTSGSWDFGDSENRGEYHKDELVDSRQSQEWNNEGGNSGADAQNRWTSIKSGYNGSSKPRVIFVSENDAYKQWKDSISNENSVSLPNDENSGDTYTDNDSRGMESEAEGVQSKESASGPLSDGRRLYNPEGGKVSSESYSRFNPISKREGESDRQRDIRETRFLESFEKLTSDERILLYTFLSEYMPKNSGVLKSRTDTFVQSIDNAEFAQFVEDFVNDELNYREGLASAAVAKHGLIVGANQGLDAVKRMFYAFNEDEYNGTLFDRAIKLAKRFGVSVKFATRNPDGSFFNAYGSYNPNDNSITLDASLLLKGNEQELCKTIVHELLHSVVARAASIMSGRAVGADGQFIDPQSLPKNVIDGINTLNEVYDAIKDDGTFQDTYGATSFEEMISEISDPKFRALLKAKSLWKKFLNGVCRILGIADKSTTESDALTEIESALDQIFASAENGELDTLYASYLGQLADGYTLEDLQQLADGDVKALLTNNALFRTGIDPTETAREAAKAVYDKVVNDTWQEFQRQFQDAYQPVRIAIDAIQQETGNIPIEDYENYLLIQNQASSRSRVEIDEFAERYYSPIVEQVNNIINKIMEARGLDINDENRRAEVYAELRRYLIAKHGLERNEYYQTHKMRNLTASEKRPEFARAKQAYDTEVANINADPTLTDAERQLKLRDAKDAYDAEIQEINTREVPDVRDYSGLTSLFGFEPKDFRKAEAEAQKVVSDFEAQFGADTDILWDRIKKATDKTLRHSYESGIISRQQYNDIKDMFEFYIPLRGFEEITAEDIYSYARFEGNRFSAAVQTAHGRTSVANDPLAYIMSMAESEITQGNKNRAKQALYNYLLNRTQTDAAGNQVQNSLMQIESVWYIKSVDGNGNTVMTLAAPDHDSGETYEEFEIRMESLAATGNAVKSRRGSVDVGMRFQKPANMSAHYVYLKVNGVEKAIYINGDPKAAEAINGTYKKQRDELGEKVGKWNRYLSSMFTNYSLEFTVRNYFRDMLYSLINIGIKESDPAYRKKFRQNWRHNNLVSMVRMLKAFRAGEYEGRALTADEAAFVEFMKNGGQTGYVILNKIENHRRDLEKAIERMQNGVVKGGVKDSTVFKYTLGAVELLNEASELVTRFAAFKTSRDMGRSVVQSISDAKEVTVNFNTKGAQDGKGWFGIAARYFGLSKYFFNASIQGVQNLKAMANANKLKFGGVVGGIVATGFWMPIITGVIAQLLGGDEEEYWNIPEYDRQNNFCIPVGNGKYVKIPLPVGFREMYAIGDMVSAMMFDKKFAKDVKSVGTDIANKIASIVLPINPLEGTANGLSIWHTIINTIAPSSAQFLIQNYGNVDWKGAPLQKEYTYNENDPQWMKAFEGNPDWMKLLSKWCYEHINADGDYNGWDWSPEKLDNTLSNLLGGVYTLIKKTGKSISMIWNEENRNMQNAPVAGVFLGSGIDSDDRFVTDAYYEMMDYYDSQVGYIKRRAARFGYDLDEVFNKEKGKHHPKMNEIYSNKNFDFMQEWYKGNEDLEKLNDKIKRLEKKIAGKENPTQSDLNKLARLKEQFAVERREFVDDMLELD